MGREPSSSTAGNVILALIVALPLAVNLWKVVARGYLLIEIWPHLVLDVLVVALFVLVVAANPWRFPLVYVPLYLAFCVSFLLANPPAGGWEWFGAIVALGVVGWFFPRLHHLNTLVALGLLISYVFVLRLMLPEMSRQEALDVLRKEQPQVVAAEALHTLFGYERFFIGLEKLRYFLLQDEAYAARLAALRALHDRVNEDLEAQGISYLSWDKLTHDYERTRRSAEQDAPFVTVTFRAGTLPGRLIERAENGVQKPCEARVAAFSVRIRRLDDGTYRVVDVPERIDVERVKGPD